MNGGQTVHGGQIGENIHNQPQNPVYHQNYGKRMIGKCIQFLCAFMAFSSSALISVRCLTLLDLQAWTQNTSHYVKVNQKTKLELLKKYIWHMKVYYCMWWTESESHGLFWLLWRCNEFFDMISLKILFFFWSLWVIDFFKTLLSVSLITILCDY